jgi:hypothetical protein
LEEEIEQERNSRRRRRLNRSGIAGAGKSGISVARADGAGGE